MKAPGRGHEKDTKGQARNHLGGGDRSHVIGDQNHKAVGDDAVGPDHDRDRAPTTPKPTAVSINHRAKTSPKDTATA